MKYLFQTTNFSSFIFLVLLLTFLCSSVSAQEADPTNKVPAWTTIYDSPETTFEEIKDNFSAYWQGREPGKGHGYKPFKRWEAYMTPRIYPSNDMSLVNNTYYNYMEWLRKQGPLTEQKSFAGNWTALGPFMKPTGEDTGVGRLNMVRFDPQDDQIMYVGAANGGLWKSVNGGGSWTTNTDFLAVIGVADLAIHPTNTSTMYLATGDVESDRRSVGVLKSTNGGTTWTATGLSWTATDNYSIRKLLMHPTNPSILIAATNKGIFRTTNGGSTWTSTQQAQNFKDLEFKPGDPNTVYACSNRMYKSTNNGVTFTQVTTGVPSSDVVRLSIAISAAQPNWVYLMAGKASNGGLLGIYKSTNSGTSFATQFEPDYSSNGANLGTPNNPNILGNEWDGSDAAGQSFYTLALAASPTDADFLIAGGVSQWASVDGGVHWYLTSHWAPDPDFEFVHADTHEIVFSKDGTKAFSSHDGGLAVFDDQTGDWDDLSSNLNISQQTIIGMSATNASKTAAGLQDIGTILNTAPNTWQVIGGGDGEYCFIDYSNDNTIVETGTNGDHSISTDGGATFTDITTGLPTDGSTGEVEFQSPIHQDPVTSTVYYAGGRKHLYRSSNRGTSWQRRGIAFTDDDSNIIEFKIAPSNHNIIYAINYANIAKSTNGGVSWNYLPEPTLNVSPSQIAISDVDPDKVWITYSGYSDGEKVYKSTDGGSNWTNLSAGLPNIPFNTIAFQNGSNDLVYVGGDIGVYHRDNAAASWTPFFDNLPRTRVRDLKIFYPTMKLRAATYGRGLWESDAASSMTLPVVLRSFTGRNSGKSNLLNWTTTEEINLAGYEVERSHDGATYQTLGRVQPQPESAERHYDFVDEAPRPGANYYRLRMVDHDESYEYSRVVVLYTEDEQGAATVFPNPTVNILKIDGLGEEELTVRVMDAHGRVVITQSMVPANGLNVSRLPNGTYFIEMTPPAGEPVVKRFVKH